MSDNLQERNQQVLSNISQLQTQEKELYSSLDNPNMSTEEKQQIINKINEVSQIRLNLYEGLKDMYAYYQQNVSSSRSTLQQEITAIDIIENELNQSKKRLNLIQDQKYNKLRLVEINTYYGKRYNAHTNLMKTIVITCIPLIILAILANKGILPPKIYRVLAALVLIIGVISLGRQLVDLSNRDNMNWDEYNWNFNSSEAPKSDGTEPQNPWATPSVTCIGSACCYEGSTYDAGKNICLPNDIYAQVNPPANTDVATTESFVSGQILGKYAGVPVKPMSLNNNVMPLNASLQKF
jgi:predicted DNA-binding protein (UPF0251 family)